jgi:hypothetical protein
MKKIWGILSTDSNPIFMQPFQYGGEYPQCTSAFSQRPIGPGLLGLLYFKSWKGKGRRSQRTPLTSGEFSCRIYRMEEFIQPKVDGKQIRGNERAMERHSILLTIFSNTFHLFFIRFNKN